MAETSSAGLPRKAAARTPVSGSSSGIVDLDYRPSYKAAGIAGFAVFVLYVITLAPSTAMWDTSEYIAAAYTLGIPHPPGNPFFVLIGRVFSILPIAPNVAMRVNLLAAICSAVSAGMWFLIAERVLVGWLAERWQRIVGGALATLIGATAFTVWSNSVVNEKVYTVSLVGVAIISWLTVRWCDDPDGPRSDKILILIAYLLGLGYSNHMAGFIPLPAVALAVLIRRPKTVLRWQLMLACAGVLALGMTPFATQPVRAAYFPAINEGEPTGCRTEFNWDCTFSAETWDAFEYNFNRGQYSKPPLSERQAPFGAQIGMWWLYFKWQWLRDPYGEAPRLQAMLAAVFLMLGLFGGYVHWRRDRRSFMFFGPLMFTLTLLLIYYLNFKYGASQGGPICDADHTLCEVRDRDYFFLWSFSAWSVWAALGLVFVWESLAALVGSTRVKVGSETMDLPLRQSWYKTAPVLVLAFIPLFANWYSASKAGETDTRDFAADMLNSVEPYGILVTVGDNDTFPLWYAQEVEGIRQDVVVMNTSLLNTDWYVRQLIRAPIREYDRERGPDIYNNREWPKPDTPPLDMTLDQADEIPLVHPLNSPQVFAVSGTNLRTQINQPQLFKADIAVLRAIQDSYGKRPVYFSRTSGPYGAELGLTPYLVTQGLAQKLVYEVPDTASRDTVLTQAGWMDIPRTTALWDSVYEAKESLTRKDKWIDIPSQGIPYLYVATGLSLFDALETIDRHAKAVDVLEEAIAIGEGVRLEEGIGENMMPQLRQMLSAARTTIPIPGGDTGTGRLDTGTGRRGGGG